MRFAESGPTTQVCTARQSPRHSSLAALEPSKRKRNQESARTMDLHGLVDGWRERNPHAPGLVTHTVNTKCGPATVQLYRYLVAVEALGLVSGAGQDLGWPGDHTAVSLKKKKVVYGPLLSQVDS